MSLKNKYNYYKAFKNMQNKNYEKAIFYFKKLLDDFSNDLSFLYNFAYCYYQNTDYMDCMELTYKIICLDDSYEDAYNLKASCFVYLEKYCDALECLNSFLEKYDGSSSLLNHKNEIEIMCNISKKGKIQININNPV